MRRFVLSICALATLLTPLFATAARAEDEVQPYSTEGKCGSEGEKALGIQTFNTPAGTFYVDDRNYPLGNGTWVYMESNNIKRLQRGGTSIVDPTDHEVCDDPNGLDPNALPEDYKPDTLIF